MLQFNTENIYGGLSYQSKFGTMISFIPDSEISTVSSFTSKSYRFRLMVGILMVSYFVVIIAIQHIVTLESSTNWSYLFLLTLLPIINILGFIAGGRYILSAMMYPFQNSIVSESLNRQNNYKLGIEFGLFLQSFVYTLREVNGLSQGEQSLLAS